MGPATCLRRGLFVVGLALAAAPVGADDLATARLHFQRGEEHFRQERFQEAFDEYQAAYAAAPLPDFLFNMGQCQRKLGNDAAALELYRKFLETDPPADRRAITEQVIAEIELEARAPAPPQEAHVTPPPPEEASPHTPVPPLHPVRSVTSGRRIRLLTWIVLAGSGQVLLVGALAAIMAGAGQTELDELDCTRELARCLEVRDETEPLFVWRNALLATGFAGLAATAVLAILDLSGTSDSPALGRRDVSVTFGPGMVGLSGGFGW